MNWVALECQLDHLEPALLATSVHSYSQVSLNSPEKQGVKFYFFSEEFQGLSRGGADSASRGSVLGRGKPGSSDCGSAELRLAGWKLWDFPSRDHDISCQPFRQTPVGFELSCSPHCSWETNRFFKEQ